MSKLPLLAVVYDRGSASATEIVYSARKLCSVVFVCEGEKVEELGAIAEVCDVTGLSAEKRRAAVAALAADGIVTFSEYRLKETAELAEACGLPFHSPDVVRGLTDKHVQRERLRAAGVESTRCEVVSTEAEVAAAVAAVGLPAVLKPRGGAGSVDTCRVDTLEQAVAVAADFFAAGPAEYVVEEFLVGNPDLMPGFGDYVSVESVAHDGVVHHVCVTGKLPLAEPFRETGMFQPAALPVGVADEVTALAGAAVAALGVERGVTHVEIKLTDDGPRLIEVNGRLGGYVAALLRRSARYDLLRQALRVALSRLPEIPELTFAAVEYVYFVTPAADAVAMTGVRGLAETASLPGVWQVEVDDTPRELDWRRGTEGHLGVVRGTAPDHGQLRTAVAAIDATLLIEYT